MNLTNKAAEELGRTLAESLHACATIPQRVAVLDTRSAIAATIYKHDAQLAFYAGFDKTLDVIEPFQQSAKRFHG